LGADGEKDIQVQLTVWVGLGPGADFIEESWSFATVVGGGKIHIIL